MRERTDPSLLASPHSAAAEAAIHFAARALRKASGNRIRLRRYRFVAQPVPQQPLLPQRPGGSMRVEQIDASHPLCAQLPRPREVIRKRFAAGGLCFAASMSGRLIGCLWLQHDRYEEDEVACLFLPRPAEQAVWDYDVYVDPAYRAGRAFTRLWDAAYAYLRSRGVKWTMSRVSAAAVDSMNAHTRLGAVRVGSAVFLCCGKREFVHVASSASVRLAGRRDGAPIIAVYPPAQGLAGASTAWASTS